MTDFLLELRSEEIPARMQTAARAELEKLFRAEVGKAGIVPAQVETFATPRRLVLIARGLPTETPAVSEEIKGPKASAPPQALEGFLRKTGLAQDQLTTRDGVYFAVIHTPGRATADVLAEAVPQIIRTFSWPKSMRWGAASASTESLRWVRPLQGIVALLGDDVVPCAVDGIISGRETMGHRFHHSGPISITSAATYADQLRRSYVIVDQAEREAIIRAGAEKAAADAGLTLMADEALVAENAGLTEWPVPLLGRFDASFLSVPPEVIRLTAKLNQKYFMCQTPSPLEGRGGSGGATEGEGRPLSPTLSPDGERGRLANAFVCTANISAHDGGAAIIAGNARVLAARLSDAKFFWEQDLKTPLSVHAEGLARITFHEKLGTVADKVERVAKLARWLVENEVVKPSPLQGRGLGEGPWSEGSATDVRAHPLSPTLSPEGEREALADMAEQAARLCKADLVTGMVGEFPELQGVMGGYYARMQGLPDAVADAIRDHYKPVGQGDEVPTAPVTVAVSLADKLDTLFGFFGINEPPTGSKDPFALRRAMLGLARILEVNQLRLHWLKVSTVIGSTFAMQYAYHMACVVPGLFYSLGKFIEGSELDSDATIQGVIGLAIAAQNAIMSDVDIEKGWSDKQRQVGWRHRDYRQTILYIESADDARAIGRPLVEFAADRLKVQQREAGVRHDLIDAVFALGGEDDLVRLLARVKALQAFIETPDGANLLAGYKRAANILKQAQREGAPAQAGAQQDAGAGLRPSPEHNAAEAALLAALDTAEPRAQAAVNAEQFESAMSALATLRAPIDHFLDKDTGVMVNDPDPAIRAFRLGLLARFRDAVHGVADFGKIEG